MKKKVEEGKKPRKKANWVPVGRKTEGAKKKEISKGKQNLAGTSFVSRFYKTDRITKKNILRLEFRKNDPMTSLAKVEHPMPNFDLTYEDESNLLI